jgi:hypothetical protein
MDLCVSFSNVNFSAAGRIKSIEKSNYLMGNRCVIFEVVVELCLACRNLILASEVLETDALLSPSLA